MMLSISIFPSGRGLHSLIRMKRPDLVTLAYINLPLVDNTYGGGSNLIVTMLFCRSMKNLACGFKTSGGLGSGGGLGFTRVGFRRLLCSARRFRMFCRRFI